MYTIQMVSLACCFPKSVSLKTAPTAGAVDKTHISRTAEAIKSFYSPGSSSSVNWQSCPLNDILQQVGNRIVGKYIRNNGNRNSRSPRNCFGLEIVYS